MIRLRVRDDKDKLRIAQAPRQSLRVSQPQPLKISQTIGPQNSRSLALEQNRLFKSGQISPQQFKSRIGAIYSGELVQPNTARPDNSFAGQFLGGFIENQPLRLAGKALQFAGLRGPGDFIDRQFDTSRSALAPTGTFQSDLARGLGGLLADAPLFSLGAAKGVPAMLQAPGRLGRVIRISPGSVATGVKHGGFEAAEQAIDAHDAGQSFLESRKTGAIAGLGQGAIEALATERLLRPLGGTMLGRAGSRFISEGLEEGAQQAFSNRVRQNYNPNTQVMDGVLRSALAGGIIGGVTSPAFDLAQRPDTRQKLRNNTNPTKLRQEVKKTRATYEKAKNKRIDLEEYGGTKEQIEAARREELLAQNDMMKAKRKLKINTTLGQSITPVDNGADGDSIRLNARADRPGTQPGNIRLSQNQDNPLDSLRQEARKYKSAEEFIKSRQDKFYGEGGDQRFMAEMIDKYQPQNLKAKNPKPITEYMTKQELERYNTIKNEPSLGYNELTDLYNEATQPTKGATGQEESIRLRPQQTAIGIKQSQQAPPGGIRLSQDQSRTPLLESRSLKLLPPGSIQLSPAQAKQRFGAMSKRGQTFEVLNQIRSGTRPIYVTLGGKARVGKDFSVPVQQRGGEKIIRVDRNPVDVDVNPNNLRDISGFEAYMKDFNRIMEKVFTAGSSQFKQVDTEIIKPLESAKGDYIRFQQDKLNDLQKTIVDGLGIKKGSPESAAVQLYGEGQITEQQLINQFGEQRANDIQEADQYFRAQYDELIETVNATRRKIYGNNPDKLIQKRKDYYRHFRDLNQGFSGLRNIFAQVSDIPPELAGTSEFTKPKSKFLSIAQRRLGIETDIDAVGGYLNYIPSAAYATYIDPQIDRLRKFKQDLVGELTGRRDKIQTLRDQMKQAIEGAEWETYDDLKTQLDSLTENGKYDDTVVNNFLGFLDDYTNDLAGKTNPADRFPQKVIGRKAFQVIDWMNKRVKANVILGNASSSIAQFFNMPQGIAQAGIKNSYKGAVRSFKTIGKPDSPMKKSNFITERYFDSYNQFDTKLFDKSRNFAAWMVQVGDEVGTKFIWNSMYEQALEQNMNEDQAIRFADNQTRKMVAGRGVGEVPLLQKSRVFQMAAPFQLEVQNLWYVLGDQVSKKEFGKLVTFAVSVHLMNSAAEAIRGSDVAFDPIEALLEAFGAFDDEEDKKVGALLAAGRLGGEVLSNVPLGQQLASIYPEYGVDIGDETVTREELFGDADPTRFGTGFGGGTLIGRGIQDPLFRLIPPFGGQQIKRSLDATQTLNRGYSETPSGRVRFPVDDGVRNRLQGTVFGQYALPEAQQYFDSGNSALGENQSEDFRNQPRDQRQQFYDDIILNRERKRNETDEEKKARKEATKQLEQERTTYSANQDSPSLFNKYGLPPVPLNDDIANAYARLQEKVNDGEVTDVSLPSAERKIVKDAYLSQLEPTVREFWSLGDDDMRKAIVSGLITKEDMDDVIALDNALFKAGILKYPQVGKTLRGELGYGLADGTQASSGRSSSRGGRSGGGRSIKVSSLAPKGSVTTANDIRIAFDKVTPKSTRTSVPGDPSRIIRIARG